jgi:hypothetical protein
MDAAGALVYWYLYNGRNGATGATGAAANSLAYGILGLRDGVFIRDVVKLQAI